MRKRERIVTGRRIVASLVLVGTLAGLLVVLPARVGFAAWITEVRDGDDDLGWNLLGPGGQERYGGNRDAYLADVAAADWATLDLSEARDVWTDDGFAHVQAEVLSDPSTVPAFLLERGLVHGVCVDGMPTGIGVFEDRRWFGSHGFGGGGLTGSQRQCNEAFLSDSHIR